MEIDPKIYEEVCEYYRNALENGYNLDTWHSAEIASDMMDCTTFSNDVSFEELHECVRRYRLSR